MIGRAVAEASLGGVDSAVMSACRLEIGRGIDVCHSANRQAKRCTRERNRPPDPVDMAHESFDRLENAQAQEERCLRGLVTSCISFPSTYQTSAFQPTEAHRRGNHPPGENARSAVWRLDHDPAPPGPRP